MLTARPAWTRLKFISVDRTFACGTELWLVGLNFGLVGPNLVPNLGPNLGPNLSPNLGPNLGPNFRQVGPNSGPNRDRTGPELFSVPPMGRQTLALCNDSSSWRDLHVGPNVGPNFFRSRLCGRVSLSGQRPTNKVRSHMWGLHPRDGPQQSSVPHRGWAMLSGLPPTSSPPPSTPLRGIRLGEAYLLRAVPPGEVSLSARQASLRDDLVHATGIRNSSQMCRSSNSRHCTAPILWRTPSHVQSSSPFFKKFGPA